MLLFYYNTDIYYDIQQGISCSVIAYVIIRSRSDRSNSDFGYFWLLGHLQHLSLWTKWKYHFSKKALKSQKNVCCKLLKSELLLWPKDYLSIFRISIDACKRSYGIVWHTGQIFLFTSIKSLHAWETNMRSISRCFCKLLINSLWRSIMTL